MVLKGTSGLTISNLCILTIEITAPRKTSGRPWKHWWVGYMVADAAASMVAWTILFVFRKRVIESRNFGMDVQVELDANFWWAMAAVPLFWWAMHALAGMYLDIRRRHRGMEIRQVLRTSVVGGVILFFLLLLDDVTSSHVDHYQTLGLWLFAHVSLVLMGRWVLTSQVVGMVEAGEWAFQTILIGSEADNQKFMQDLESTPGKNGWNMLARLSEQDLGADLAKLGRWLDHHVLDRAVLTTPMEGRESMLGWIAILEGKGVEILVVPGALDYMAGTVRSSNLFAVPLVNLSRVGLSQGMRVLKRFLDLMGSATALLILFPLLAWIALRIKLDSQGPVFYRQERLGLHGRPFRIVKFRTMVPRAEGNTPKLSSTDDPRITGFGKTLRQSRLDELPQFWNVLKGEMSLVGPRPERAFFADQIVKHSPHFLRLQQVRPGITSWGQVKYGYAENVNEMRQRLRYDIMYLENQSLLLDLKILLYTVRTVLRREGK